MVFEDQVALFIEHLRDARRVARGGGEGAVVQAQLACVVTPDLILKALFVYPVSDDLKIRGRNPNDLDSQGLKLVVSVAVPATFNRSTTGIGGGQKPHHCDVALEGVWTP